MQHRVTMNMIDLTEERLNAIKVTNRCQMKKSLMCFRHAHVVSGVGKKQVQHNPT